MIHPSYNELIEIINQGNEEGENPEINSRYSIVMAAAKRARQLIDGGQSLVSKAPVDKPLSIAVEELRRGKVKVTEEGVDEFQLHLRASENAPDIVYDEENDVQETEIDDSGDNEDADAE